MGTSSYEHSASCRSGYPLVSSSMATHGQYMGQCLRGGAFRHSSPAGGIGGLGGGTKRCAQRGVFYAHTFSLRTLRAQRPFFFWPIHDGAGSLCAGFNVQTDTGNIAVCVTATGLLAPSQSP